MIRVSQSVDQVISRWGDQTPGKIVNGVGNEKINILYVDLSGWVLSRA